MQLAAIEYARNVLMLEDANTTEIDEHCKNPIITIQPNNSDDFGGTLRLGLYSCEIKKPSKMYDAYQKNSIAERHRHRYEFNNAYRDIFETKNLIISGLNTERNLVEAIELKDHPWFVAVQYHPEFLSRPLRPHPLFHKFIEASLKNHLSK